MLFFETSINVKILNAKIGARAYASKDIIAIITGAETQCEPLQLPHS